MNTDRFCRVKSAINDLPVIDIHTHLGTGDVRQARDLTDILFYHWLGRELKNAGCHEEICTPRRNGVSGPALPRERVRAAIPYLAKVRNTSNYWAFIGIMRDLYGIEGDINESNWEKAFDIVSERAADPSWEMKVLELAKIEKAAVEHNCVSGESSTYFNYVYAEPLYGVGLGRPDSLETILGKQVETAAELEKALKEIVGRLVKGRAIHALHVWLPAIWRYTATEESEIDHLLHYWKGGEILSSYEQNCMVSFSADVMADEASKYGLVVQMFHGSAAYGRSLQVSTWHPDYLRTLIYHFGKHPDTKYDLFLGTRNASHEVTSMAQMHTNLMLSGAWWHGFTPSTLTEFFRDRLEMLPITRWNAFYSDAYCVEWCYGKLLVTKNWLAVALTQLIEEGLIGEDDVVPIARAVLYDNPKRQYLGVKAR